MWFIRRSEARKAWNFTVLFVDIDRFKQVNDRLGHLAGDHLIQEIAKRLQQGVRKTRSNMHSMGARYAGDEFVIVLDDVNTEEEALVVTRRIQEQLAAPVRCGDGQVVVEVSVGIVLASPELQMPEEYVQHSDLAMYRAKSTGGGDAPSSLTQRCATKISNESLWRPS